LSTRVLLLENVSKTAIDQTLATDPDVGYLVMDLDQDVSAEVHQRIAALPTNVRTRII
jgi:D-3-phosphoglycerate dehydrogenase